MVNLKKGQTVFIRGTKRKGVITGIGIRHSIVQTKNKEKFYKHTELENLKKNLWKRKNKMVKKSVTQKH